MIHSRTTWSDYFTGRTTLYQSIEYRATQTLSDTSLYVSNCLFRSITASSGKSGALFCTSVTLLLIESTSFFSCKTSNYFAGAIYFSNTNNGQCVLNEICGYDCYSTYTGNDGSHGQFTYVDASKINFVNYSSVARCVNENSYSWHTLCHQFGKISCLSVNSSTNKCYGRTGIYCYPLIDSNSITCSLTHSSFVDNIATGHCCIMLWRDGAKHEIKSCNIIRNTQDTLGTEGTFLINGNLMIKDSCILENTATNIFFQGSSSYTITLSNCTVDSTSNNGYLTIKNTVTKSFIHALNHMSTQNCHSEYDSDGHLTPIIQTLKNQKLYCTCEKLLNRCQPCNKFSLISILVFNFIHQCTSSDI
jgi:hypothetical protein